MAGDWDAPDLAGVLAVFAGQMASLVPARLQAFRRLAVKALPSAHLGSQANTRRNISAHYDLSNEMFELFLDPSMSYSSALFDPATDPDGRRAGPGDGASSARSSGCSTSPACARARPSWRSAPAGASSPCGRHAAAPGCTRSRCRSSRRSWPATGWPRPGLSDLVQVEVCDYRDTTGQLRRRGVGRDDRGGRPRLLGRLLPHRLRAHRPARPRGDPGDHDAARPDARDARHLHLDPEVHLPRRVPAVDRVDHGRRPPGRAGRPGAAGVRAALRPDAADLARPVRAARRRRSRPPASTRCSAGCGRCTSPTPRPASRPRTSTSSRSSSSTPPTRRRAPPQEAPDDRHPHHRRPGAGDRRRRRRRTSRRGRRAPVPRSAARAAAGLGRQRGRPGRRTRRRAAHAGRPAPHRLPAGRARSRAGVRHRRARGRGRPARRLPPGVGTRPRGGGDRADHAVGAGQGAAHRARPRRDRAARLRRPRPRPACAAACTPSCATGRRSRTTTTCRTTSTR